MKKYLKNGSKLIFILITFMFTGCMKDWSEKEIKESQIIGNMIVLSLNTYKADNKKYPKDLEELVPEYIDQIKEPKVGKWVYKINPVKNSFYLAFESKSDYGPICWYSPNAKPNSSGVLKDWRVDTR